MYRELSVHLKQVCGLETQVLLRSDPNFNYVLDQVDCVAVTYPVEAIEQLAQILHYYSTQYPQIPSVAVQEHQESQALNTNQADLANYLKR